MPKFGHLRQRFDTVGGASTMTLPCGTTLPDGRFKASKLHLKHAGDTNVGWANALKKHNAKTGIARRAMQGRGEVEDMARERDFELYPRHIVVGWTDVCDEDGNDVTFSEDNCREYLRALPSWIFDEVRGYAIAPTNFLPGDVPDKLDREDSAGN